MESGEEISGPWRATKLWNTIIRNFRSGMPLKKHKKNMRTYENCFSSTEAVDWLQRSLQRNPNFGAEVTKEQTVLLLQKLFRAGIIENVREDCNDEEFKVSGELYRFSNKSPVRILRTPGKAERKPLSDTGNTPHAPRSKDGVKDEFFEKPEREKGSSRKTREEMKKQLNLSYFQSLPSNSLIILDNDDTWKRVYMDQLTRALSQHHTERLDYAGQLDIENVMHNMTRVSAKGIVQVDGKNEDLPHWVLSAMKCLANWPKQLRTVNGKESCLPNYTGFEHDVFNVVKDYFIGLPGPLTTISLYDFLVEAYLKAERDNSIPVVPTPVQTHPGQPCGVHPSSVSRACTRPYTQTNLDNEFFTMSDNSEEFSALSHTERVAKIRHTFQVLPPLATSSLQTSNNTNSTLSGHSTFDTISPCSLSPDMSTTAIMKQFLPPNTCFETAFVEESPITRIVPQREHEVLHIRRTWSGRSLSHISTDWSTKSTSTQTDTAEQAKLESMEQVSSSSLKRIPKWKRTSRFRKSIAVMESQDRRKLSLQPGDTAEGGLGFVNGGFADTPESRVSRLTGPTGRPRQLNSTSGLPAQSSSKTQIRGYSSVDNLLDRENKFEEDFIFKYKQVSGDLRSSYDHLETGRDRSDVVRDKSFIESKAMRKEKKKRRFRNASTDRLGYDTDTDVRYETYSRVNGTSRHCYVNEGLEELSPIPNYLSAPLASEEFSDLSPVPFNRHGKYNTSYRLANNQPETPKGNLPRTSTQINLQPRFLDPTQQLAKPVNIVEPENCIYVRAEPYNCLNSDVSNSVASERNYRRDTIYTSVGPGPIQRYSVPVSAYPYISTMRPPQTQHRSSQRPAASNPVLRPETFRRDTAARASRSSQATVDSGRYSDLSRGSNLGLRVHPSPQPGTGPDHARFSKKVPHNVLVEKLQGLVSNPGKVEETAVNIFKLLTLLLPPSNRRRLQLLLKFIRKVALNTDLRLDQKITNRDLSLLTFTEIILRPGDIYTVNHEINRKIVSIFLEKYDEIWSPPQTLRREVEEKVYQSLVNRRLKAGEDPYPVTYCRQVTKSEYESAKLSGAEAALLDLLQAILRDNKMTDKEKTKKMKKFKESYPQLWRRQFPTESSEPELVSRKDKFSKFSSLSRIKNVMRI